MPSKPRANTLRAALALVCILVGLSNCSQPSSYVHVDDSGLRLLGVKLNSTKGEIAKRFPELANCSSITCDILDLDTLAYQGLELITMRFDEAQQVTAIETRWSHSQGRLLASYGASLVERAPPGSTYWVLKRRADLLRANDVTGTSREARLDLVKKADHASDQKTADESLGAWLNATVSVDSETLDITVASLKLNESRSGCPCLLASNGTLVQSPAAPIVVETRNDQVRSITVRVAAGPNLLELCRLLAAGERWSADSCQRLPDGKLELASVTENQRVVLDYNGTPVLGVATLRVLPGRPAAKGTSPESTDTR